MFAKFSDFWRYNDLTVRLAWVVLEVISVVIFGGIEGVERFHPCRDWVIPNA